MGVGVSAPERPGPKSNVEVTLEYSRTVALQDDCFLLHLPLTVPRPPPSRRVDAPATGAALPGPANWADAQEVYDA